MLPAPTPSSSTSTHVEPVREALVPSLREYVQSLAVWAESARLHSRYPEANSAAREVLRLAQVPPPNQLLATAPWELPQLLAQGTTKAAALALTVVGRNEWGSIRSAKDGEVQEKIETAKLLFWAACQLEPASVEHRRALHGFLHELRQRRDQGRDVITHDTQSLLDSLTQLLRTRYGFKARGMDWISSAWDPQTKSELLWCLEECANLSRARAASIPFKQLHRATPYYESAIHFALSGFAVQGLPFQTASLHQVNLTALSRSQLKAIQKGCRILREAYAVLTIAQDLGAINTFIEHVNFSIEHAPSDANQPLKRQPLAARPLAPSAFRAEASFDARPPVLVATAPTVPAETQRPASADVQTEVATAPPPTLPRPVALPETRPEPKPQRNVNVWLSPCRVAAEQEPFSIPEKLLIECKRPIDSLRDKYKITRDAIEKALPQFAIEMDLLARKGNEAAAPFLEHYANTFAEHAADAAMLVRIQVAAGFLLDSPWLADDLKSSARNLASLSNLTLQGMSLRKDLGALQEIFKPLAVAAKFNRLRPRVPK